VKKKILISTGGSGGHVLPAISLSEHLKDKFEVIISTDNRGLRFLNEEQNYILINTPRLQNFYLLPINLILIFILTLKSISIIKQKKIDRIISIGGYMSLPIWLAAKFLSKRIDLCEPNLVLGKANKFYLNYAKNILCYHNNIINFPEKFDYKKLIIRPLIRKKFYNKNVLIKKKYFEITIFGGSQGAEIFDNFINEGLLKVSQKTKIKVNHQTNQKNLKNLKKFYEKNDIENEVFNYKPDFFNLIKNSDLCITRAGASALAEIALLNIPFITIPLKNSADDHQKENAKYYEKLNCCWIINQEELNHNKIEELCLMIIENKDEYNKKRENLKKLNEQNSWKNLNNNLIQFFNDN
jgi:UDP-N-acetylglucosamine--N-acetylmuramyl-(pentapeptide) pyrophosphoryl-undecaprenol N-acetylglucosamine transferase